MWGGGGCDARFSPCVTAKDIINAIKQQWAEKQNFEWDDPASFARVLEHLCTGVEEILKTQDYPMLQLQSPIYILGDIHGNFADLDVYLSNLINFGDMRCAWSQTAAEEGGVCAAKRSAWVALRESGGNGRRSFA